LGRLGGRCKFGAKIEARPLLPSVQRMHGYYNNHYAGYGAGSALLFRRLWDGTEAPPPPLTQGVLLSDEPEIPLSGG